MKQQAELSGYQTVDSYPEESLVLPINKRKTSEISASGTASSSLRESITQDTSDNEKKDRPTRPKLVNIFANKHRKNFRRFLEYSFKFKALLFWGNFGLLVTSASQICLPYLTGRIVDIITGSKSKDELMLVAIGFVCCGVISGVFSFIRGYSFNLLGEKVMLELRSELFEKFIQKDIEFFDRNKSGELMSRISSDTSIIQSAASDSLSMLLRNLIQFIGSFIILWVISYELTLIIFMIVPPLIIVIFLFIRKFKSYSKSYQDILAVGNSAANEAFGNVRVVKSFARENKESSRFHNHLLDAYKFGEKKSILHGSLIGTVTILGEGALLCVIWYGGEMVLDNKLTTGQLSSFILYTITLSAGLLAVGGVSNMIITAVGISEKLFEMMDVQKTIISGQTTKNCIDGRIQFDNVSFEYPTKPGVEVLKNVNFEVKQGQVVALVGSSGSGKSSTVSLLQRFYDSTKGSVKIDGLDIKDYNLSWLREQIGYVSQEPTLFSGSLKENITYGINSYIQSDIDNALEMANAKNFVYDKLVFPEGLQTVVGERGVKLSGGQKQRIAIARALIKNPKILIFDEATSALDAESEYQVQQAIDNLMVNGQKTIIVIAHRLSTVKNADNIIVMANGEIKETGTHKELIKDKEGVYSKLIERQMTEHQGEIPSEI